MSSAPVHTPKMANVVTLLFVLIVLLVTLAYLVVRTVLFAIGEYNWFERLIAGSLLFAESFVLFHGVGYFANVWRVLRGGNAGLKAPENLPELDEYPPVAIIVSAYKEPLDVVENNLICFRNLTYPNKHVYFLDDTRYELAKDGSLDAYRAEIDRLCKETGVNLFRRRWHGAKAGMINDWLEFIEGHPPEGYEFHPFQPGVKPGNEKYIVVFDADMNPLPDFVEPLVQILEASPKISFVQTPQYYTNFETNRVARASGLQQAIFYEYICEGKSSQDAMFCCGTNVMFRREALVGVGGFDESSITEDFATSLKFHMQGWSSAYLNRVCAFGMGPNDLGGFFKQQFRWALGTIGLFRTIFGHFVRNPGALPFRKWLEYFLSGTHYFVGWVFLTLLVCPVIYLFTGYPRYFAHPMIFFLFFTPYLTLTLLMFMLTLRGRGYRPREIFGGLLLTNISFPVYMKASVLGVAGVRGSFGITPKAGSASLPLRSLVPQILAMVVTFAAFVWGIHKIIYMREPMAALVVNSIWCAYNFILLWATLYFNNPEEQPPEGP